MKADITAIIPTFNEETNIQECIRSIKNYVKEIIIMDNYSTDTTKEIAEKMGAIVYQSHSSYKERLNNGINLKNIKTKWILNIDADERLTEKSGKEIVKLCTKYESNNTINGIVLHYQFVFMGKILKHGFKPYKMRLFKKGTAYMENKELDEHFVLKTGKCVYCKSCLIHHDYKGMDSFIIKLNNYSKRVAKEYFDLKAGRSVLPMKGLSAVSRFRRHIKYKFYYKMPISIRSHLYYIYSVSYTHLTLPTIA